MAPIRTILVGYPNSPFYFLSVDSFISVLKCTQISSFLLQGNVKLSLSHDSVDLLFHFSIFLHSPQSPFSSSKKLTMLDTSLPIIPSPLQSGTVCPPFVTTGHLVRKGAPSISPKKLGEKWPEIGEMLWNKDILRTLWRKHSAALGNLML